MVNDGRHAYRRQRVLHTNYMYIHGFVKLNAHTCLFSQFHVAVWHTFWNRSNIFPDAGVFVPERPSQLTRFGRSLTRFMKFHQCPWPAGIGKINHGFLRVIPVITLFCHSFSHTIWKYIPFFSDILFGILFYLASIPTYFPAYTLTLFLTFYLASILTFYLTSFQAFILEFFLAAVLTFSLTFFLAFKFDIYSDILSGTLSDILSGVWLKSGSAHWDLTFAVAVRWDLVLTVEVRQCPLISGACGWGRGGEEEKRRRCGKVYDKIQWPSPGRWGKTMRVSCNHWSGPS